MKCKHGIKLWAVVAVAVFLLSEAVTFVHGETALA